MKYESDERTFVHFYIGIKRKVPMTCNHNYASRATIPSFRESRERKKEAMRLGEIQEVRDSEINNLLKYSKISGVNTF